MKNFVISSILAAVVAPGIALGAGKPSVEETAKAAHVRAIDRALAGDTRGALAILGPLTEAKISADEKDRVYLSLGRIYYQAGDDNASIEFYDKVRKGSATWLEALEEKAWAQMRKGEPEKSLATLKTVLTPIFKDRVPSEPFFLASLGQLRVCDYPALFKTLDLFKDRFRGKIKGWESSIAYVDKARLKEARDTIQKINLVEAEAIQRLYMDESGKRLPGRVAKIERGSNELNFPEVSGEEVWMDEIDSYRVKVKDCPVVQFADGSDKSTVAKKD